MGLQDANDGAALSMPDGSAAMQTGHIILARETADGRR